MNSRLLAAGFLTLCVIAATLGARREGWLQPLELLVYDQWTRGLSQAEARDPRFVLLEITEPDIQTLGNWPLSDRQLAETLRRLIDADVLAVGVDLHRDLPVAPGEFYLTRVLEGDERVIAVRQYGDSEFEGVPGPAVLDGTDRVGFLDILVDPDGIVRRGLLFLDDDGVVGYSLALRLALFALARQGITPEPDTEVAEWLRLGPATFRPLSGNDGGYAGEDDAGYQFLLDFAGAREVFDSIELAPLLRGEIDPERIRGKIALIGASAVSLRGDRFRVPFETEFGIPGVELHAHMVRQLYRNALGETAPRRFLSDWQEAALIGVLAALGCALGIWAQGATATLGALLLGVGLLWLSGRFAFEQGVWVPMVAPALSWLGSVALVQAWTSSTERAHRALLMQLFEAHVSPEIADEVWRQRDAFFHGGRPRAQRLTASVLFVDIVNYTPRAEKMDPERHTDWLNTFLAEMARTVQEHGGYVDDYFGDGLKADFGVPLARETEAEIAADARAAVACALAMRAALGGLNARYRERSLPDIAVRVGIDTGPAVAGSVGSERKLKYTVLGDVPVTAQRVQSIEGVEHDFSREPCRILVSDRTHSHLGGGFSSESLGLFSVKGKGEKVGLHRILGAAREKETS